ncbi:uncharacterized protein CEXT_503491 [Caerostris extrusa]|uniref:Uncharacterized protein n=1 Tax=Caerostris extrusa TaxID=172846 RepID=A0AAV4NYR3_CAEEX|nr:uncharacterized protein CEXT_503491 [Caerostris extrusa]
MVTLCDVQKRTYLMCLAVWSACLALAVEGCLHCKQKPPKVYVLSPSSRTDYIVSEVSEANAICFLAASTDKRGWRMEFLFDSNK